jgi:hypothetical protein
MRNALGAAIDDRLEASAVRWARRQCPALGLVPSRWIRPVIKPTVVRLRRALSWGAIAIVLSSGIILALLITMH